MKQELHNAFATLYSGYNYLAKDKDDSLWVYKDKPILEFHTWSSFPGGIAEDIDSETALDLFKDFSFEDSLIEIKGKHINYVDAIKILFPNVKWFAKDSDGATWIYEHKPKLDCAYSSIWQNIKGQSYPVFLQNSMDHIDFKESLISIDNHKVSSDFKDVFVGTSLELEAFLNQSDELYYEFVSNDKVILNMILAEECEMVYNILSRSFPEVTIRNTIIFISGQDVYLSKKIV